MIVFDLDGTLIDTREAVREAYLAAGVEMPDAAWGKPWHTWLPQLPNLRLSPEEIHKIKNANYKHCLREHGRVLPCLQYAVQLDAPIITGASVQAIAHVKTWLSEQGYHLRSVDLFGASYDMKQFWLNTTSRGIYVDDDVDVRVKLRESTRWLVASPEQFLKFAREL